MKTSVSLIFGLLISFSSVAQNVLSLHGESPKASIEDVAWIHGYWSGDAFGGTFEEVWNKPFGGSMSATFKLVIDGKVSLYEMLIIAEENETLVYKLKHFNADLSGWEEKDEYMSFPLVKIEENKAWFDGISFFRIDENTIHVFLKAEDHEEEIKFVFKKS